ncbi:hypothetical protein [Streptomyces sp. NPDC047981]|uniref:hypothetical protein n=1 Tax=Streptomyces sp. NPDC047981 TaxID=3154610 RepID=UPI0034322495
MTAENPELTAALAEVPEIKRTEDAHEAATKLLARHPAGEEPDRARARVVDEVVHGFAATGKWPADVGTRVASAYTEALAWEAERLALKAAVDYTRELAADTREALAGDALAHLGRRLSDVLSDARSAAESLVGVATAEEAIRAGGDALSAWSRLQSLTVDVANIREAQWAVHLPPLRRHQRAGDDPRRAKLQSWKRAGHGETRGYRPDDVPEFALQAMRHQRYTVNYVVWLAQLGTAYVPEGYDDLADEVEASTPAPVMFNDAGPVRDMSPIETRIPEAKRSDVYPHSRVAHVDFSAPIPDAPEPNATPGDPAPPVWRY